MDWNKIPDQDIIDRTVAGLKERNFNPTLAENRAAALHYLKQMVPPGAEVMNGSSSTLEEVGFITLLADPKSSWQNWKDRILAERDREKRLDLRRLSTTADYFLGSVQAVTEAGQVLTADATGGRQSGYVFSARRVIWVVGVNKIVPDLDAAFSRLQEHCVPLEDARMKSAGAEGTYIGKTVIFEREGQPRRISTLLVREKLGF